jgi:DNA-binding SARP family transcriptional activator
VAVLVLVVIAILVVRRKRSVRPADKTTEERPDRVSRPAPDVVAPIVSDALTPEPTLRIELMGAVRLAPAGEPPSEFARALLCYLAVHDDRPRSVDDTQTALWPTVGTESDISRKTFLNYVSEVRGIVGTEHFPENARRRGYRLVDTTTDWHEFRLLVAEAGRLTGPDRHQARVSALQLVRGVPFESELSRWFQWADSEGLRTAITKAVVKVAVDAHAERVQAGDLEGAEWALRQGLKCNPLELSLWAYLADVVQARDDKSDLERFWRDAIASLDPSSVGMLRDRVRG